MRRHKALQVAIEECKKLNVKYRFELPARNSHYKFYIENVKRVLIISDTRALCNVRCDVRRLVNELR